MASRKNTGSKRGRPKEGRIPMIVHVLPACKELIDGSIDAEVPAMNSRGKVIERKFKISVN